MSNINFLKQWQLNNPFESYSLTTNNAASQWASNSLFSGNTFGGLNDFGFNSFQSFETSIYAPVVNLYKPMLQSSVFYGNDSNTFTLLSGAMQSITNLLFGSLFGKTAKVETVEQPKDIVEKPEEDPVEQPEEDPGQGASSDAYNIAIDEKNEQRNIEEKPAENLPAEKPVEKPAETKAPAEVKTEAPAETKPADTTPADTKTEAQPLINIEVDGSIEPAIKTEENETSEYPSALLPISVSGNRMEQSHKIAENRKRENIINEIEEIKKQIELQSDDFDKYIELTKKEIEEYKKENDINDKVNLGDQLQNKADFLVNATCEFTNYLNKLTEYQNQYGGSILTDTEKDFINSMINKLKETKAEFDEAIKEGTKKIQQAAIEGIKDEVDTELNKVTNRVELFEQKKEFERNGELVASTPSLSNVQISVEIGKLEDKIKNFDKVCNRIQGNYPDINFEFPNYNEKVQELKDRLEIANQPFVFAADSSIYHPFGEYKPDPSILPQKEKGLTFLELSY